MKSYCQLEHLQFFGDEPSVSDETGTTCDDNDQACTRPIGFSRDHISIQVSTPKSPFYTTLRTRKTSGLHCSCRSCSSPVSDYYDNYFPTTPGYISRQQVQYSPKLALPFMAPNMSFKSFKIIQDHGNHQFCGYGYPYAVVTPHKTVITPRRTTIRDENDEEGEDEDEETIDGSLLERILNVFRRLPENLRVQFQNLEGLDEQTSAARNLIVSSTTSRGLGEPMEDSSLKLEWIKIRTVDIDDTVTTEKEKK